MKCPFSSSLIDRYRHIDCNVNDYGYEYYNANNFFDTFNFIKEKYQTKLIILCGIEFSEPQLYQRQLSEYLKLPYDYILGSIRVVG